MYKRIFSLFLSILIFSASLGSIGSYAAENEQDAVFPAQESLLMAPLTEEGYLIDSLSLPEETLDGNKLIWNTSDSDVISANGNVTRATTENKVVILTACYETDSQITKEYEFTVASLTSQAAGMPKLDELEHEDEFDDEAIDSKYVTTKVTGGAVTEEDGALVISRTKTSGDLWAAINAGTEAVSGRYMLEYVLEASAAKQICTRLYGGNGANLTSVDILANGALSYWSRPSSDEAGGWGSIGADSSRMPKVKMSVFVDTETQSYSLWLNNKIVINNVFK